MAVDVDDYAQQADAWFAANAPRRPPDDEPRWGDGPDEVALFRNLSIDDERAHIDEVRSWQRAKVDAGFGAVTWPTELGGAGLTADHEQAVAARERAYVTPAMHEAVSITVDLVAPTIRAIGTAEQTARHVPAILRTDDMWCQLFSEPGAGSDLAGLATRAERDGDQWAVNGQKVWTSGAQYADHGLLIARSDPSAPKHKGLTAFLVDMRAPGVEVRPLRQMSGGRSFNEVFFTDVLVADRDRLGAEGAGWQCALATLAFEREATAEGGAVTTRFLDRLVDLARWLGRTDDAVVRQELARAYASDRIRALTQARGAAAARASGVPGPEGSIGKLAFTGGLRHMSEVAGLLLGPRLAADTGEWGTFAWTEFVNGAPGYRIAGGSDEIQRNIIAERVLGLPRDPQPG